MLTEREISDILAYPATSYRLKAMVETCTGSDPVDALADAELLVDILQSRLSRMNPSKIDVGLSELRNVRGFIDQGDWIAAIRSINAAVDAGVDGLEILSLKITEDEARELNRTRQIIRQRLDD